MVTEDPPENDLKKSLLESIPILKSMTLHNPVYFRATVVVLFQGVLSCVEFTPCRSVNYSRKLWRHLSCRCQTPWDEPLHCGPGGGPWREQSVICHRRAGRRPSARNPRFTLALEEYARVRTNSLIRVPFRVRAVRSFFVHCTDIAYKIDGILFRVQVLFISRRRRFNR